MLRERQLWRAAISRSIGKKRKKRLSCRKERQRAASRHCVLDSTKGCSFLLASKCPSPCVRSVDELRTAELGSASRCCTATPEYHISFVVPISIGSGRITRECQRTHGGHGGGERKVAVLAVHVVCARARVVPEPGAGEGTNQPQPTTREHRPVLPLLPWGCVGFPPVAPTMGVPSPSSACQHTRCRSCGCNRRASPQSVSGEKKAMSKDAHPPGSELGFPFSACHRQLARIPLHPLSHLLDAHNLASGLLHLLELRKEVPEAALCYRLVGSEDGHLVQRRRRLALRRALAANHLVLLKLQRLRSGRMVVSRCISKEEDEGEKNRKEEQRKDERKKKKKAKLIHVERFLRSRAKPADLSGSTSPVSHTAAFDTYRAGNLHGDGGERGRWEGRASGTGNREKDRSCNAQLPFEAC